eukprot:TRINITY_DN15669_c0_g1_i1.p1 TRINITY_DN15669_c0_g1~~TRINITY_DN15669_c0_g1_i1.p1  ORF type:complete len:168 (-),score=30.44 TRINITY_DN15669_c0_g1_i1:73-516(-)
MGAVLGIPDTHITLDGNTNGFWSKYLIQRNSAENIMKPNILQTLLSGRKKRDAGMEEELNDNTVDTKDSNGERIRLLELLGLVEEEEGNCSGQLWGCMESAAEFAFEQANSVRVSKKFNKESHFQSLLTEGRNTCKTSYELCVKLKQ